VDAETLEVETEREGQYEAWNEVADFSQSGADDPHFVLDGVTGEIELGPLIRQSDGQERQFGRVPPLGRRVRFTSYRWGGGVIGNVGKRTISILKSSIPYVATVINFAPAVGGTDAETLEAAKLRAPAILRNHTRAVTADDFEYLAVQASQHVARAKCLAAGRSADGRTIPPGVVRVLLVPRVEDLDRPISKDQLRLLASVRSAVQEYLDERRLLTARVEIAAPEYRQIAVEADVRVRPGCDFERVAEAVKTSLYRYINPVCGGPKGQGWPFGRSLFTSEVNSVVQSTEDVDYLEDVRVYSVDWETGQRQPVDGRLTIPPNGLICSAEHQVKVQLVEGYE
jgi:predicted phage baseplate assembly protein